MKTASPQKKAPQSTLSRRQITENAAIDAARAARDKAMTAENEVRMKDISPIFFLKNYRHPASAGVGIYKIGTSEERVVSYSFNTNSGFEMQDISLGVSADWLSKMEFAGEYYYLADLADVLQQGPGYGRWLEMIATALR